MLFRTGSREKSDPTTSKTISISTGCFMVLEDLEGQIQFPDEFPGIGPLFW